MGRRIVNISQDILIHIMTEGYEGTFRTIKGLPKDALFIKCLPSDDGVCGFVYESEEWSDVPPGDTIPTVEVIHERIPLK
jgi:hypothetical protein